MFEIKSNNSSLSHFESNAYRMDDYGTCSWDSVSDDEDGRGEALSQVEYQQEWPVLLSAPATHLALGVGRIDHFVDISALYPEEGHDTPSSEKSNEEEETNDVCAGSFLRYRIISIITIGFSIALVTVPLKLFGKGSYFPATDFCLSHPGVIISVLIFVVDILILRIHQTRGGAVITGVSPHPVLTTRVTHLRSVRP